ncbi:MAG TPA: DNA polymerase III subunit delta' [Pyrinomonadaceae bacterium]|nr:DNA polymerase III subunit delta' [Pyrinomonadaceae bacterium]
MLDQLAGNQRVKQIIQRMLEFQRLPGALLFAGEEGIGKKLFALEVARALNCRSLRGVQGCGECSSCQRISRFNYPQSEDSEDWKQIIWTDHGDVGMVVAPKRVLLVDQMRQIEREANFRPFEGNARVFLIDDADKLNEPAANALLKVLEEPPPTSHLILITSQPAMLLPTIRSRCQVVRFSPLTAAEIEEYLIRNQSAPKKEAALRARVARGSIGRALASDVRTLTEQRFAMLEVLKALTLTGDRLQLLRSAEELNEARYKDEYEARLDILETLIRDALALAVGTPATRIVNEDLLNQLMAISKRVSTGQAARWITQIEELREQLIVNINRKVATDALFLSMACP